MNTNLFIIHGAYGHPGENWFPWLKSECEAMGHSVYVPGFPTPEGQSLDNWLKTFSPYQQYVNRDSVFVGHSLGPAFILRLLEGFKDSIHAAFLIAGFISPLGNPEFDKINSSFINKKFDFSRIRRNCGKFFVYNSDNDPYVPLERGRELANCLKTQLHIIHGAGHFNTAAGYTKFPLLFQQIKEVLAEP